MLFNIKLFRLFQLSKKLYFYLFSLYYFILLNIFIFFVPQNAYTAIIALGFTLLVVLPYLFVLFSISSSKTFLKPLPVISAHVLSSFLILTYFPNLVVFFKEGYIIFSTIIFYFLSLSFNIFFVVSQKGSSIPLLRPAKVTFLQLQIIIAFLLFTAIFKTSLHSSVVEFTFLIQSIVIFAVCFTFSSVYWWSQQMEKEITSFIGNESLIIAFLVSAFAVSISFFEMESFFRALLITAVFYICINYFQSIVSHKFTNKSLIEYAVVAAIVLLVVLGF
ncbi:hypothetical protein KA001_03225 [Patescibacteria group bacterium]|nr:hypothetical protein [Patescibacteria group bacterium]